MRISSRIVCLAAVILAAALVGCGDDDVVPPMTDGGVTPRDGSGGDASAPETCTTAGASEMQACGMCGTRTRFCTTGLIWEYSACTGEHGVCMAGASMMVPCGPGGTVMSRCSDMCAWQADGVCSTPLWSCAMPLDAESREGTVSISSDTSAGGPGPLDLGMCGTAPMDPTMRPAQLVVRYVVPGTGMRSIRITTANDGTPANFDTLVQVRRGDCAMAPAVRDGTCFDDGVPPAMPPAMPAEYRTLGNFVAMGGETLYFVVTGFGTRGMPTPDHVNEGPFRLDITPGDLTPPTLTMATVNVVTSAMGPGTGRVTVTGGDTGGDAVGVVVTLLDAAGMPVDTNADMMVNAADDFRAPFAPPGAAGMMTFTLTADTFGLADAVMRTSAPRARVRVFDAIGSESAPLTVDVQTVSEVGFGATCDATHVCTPLFACMGGTCGATAAVTAACTAATPVMLSGTPARGTATGMLPMGAGVMPRPTGMMCIGMGAEVLYTVTVPAGAFDLVASTQVAGTDPMLDTVVWAQSVCANPASGPMDACSDDVMMDRRAKLVVQNIAAGTYTVAVSAFTALAAPAPFGLDVTLRPVLATGAACDPMGVMNRCATGTCPAGAICP